MLTQNQRGQDEHRQTHTCVRKNKVKNLTNIKFTKEQIKTLEMGPQYAIEKKPKQYINELIIDTENSIRCLHNGTQNTFRYLAAKKIKQIGESNRNNIMQKRHQYNVNQIKQILQQNNLTIAKADKSKALVINDKTALTHKVHTFIHENDMVQLNKDPTETYQKQIQLAIQNSEELIEKDRPKYLLNIKPTAPRLNAYIQTHKENEPIRPVIDNTQAPAYKPQSS